MLKETDEILKEQRAAFKKRIVNFGTSDRFTFVYGIIAVSLGIVYIIRRFSGTPYDRPIDGSIEGTIIWLSTFRNYCAKILHPDHRALRWWVRILVVFSLISIIFLIRGSPGPRFFR